MKKVLILSLIAILLAGCGVKWKAKQCRKLDCCQAVKDSTVYHIKDSTYLIHYSYTVDGDSAYVFAWMECDSLYNVVLRNSEVINGKYIRLQKDIENGKYTVVAYYPEHKDTGSVAATSHQETIYKDVIKQVKVNELTAWQKFKCSAFPYQTFANILFLLLILYYLYRRFRS